MFCYELTQNPRDGAKQHVMRDVHMKMAAINVVTALHLVLAVQHSFALDTEEGVCLTLLGRAGRCTSLGECGRLFLSSLFAPSAGKTRSVRTIQPIRCSPPLICCGVNPFHLTASTIYDESLRAGPEKPNVVKLTDTRLSLLNLDTCGASSQQFIVNGKRASPGQFPWIALLCSVRADGREQCTCAGTLISEHYVVTAAHCVTNTMSKSAIPSLVLLGEDNRNTDPDCDLQGHCAPPVQKIAVGSILVHPEYNPLSKQNDIALIRLARVVNLTEETVCPICLPIDRIQYKDLVNVPELVVAGWGSTDHVAEAGMSRVLMFAGVREVPHVICRQAHRLGGQQVSPSQICVNKDEQGSCRGDSGGPLMMMDEVPWTKETRALLVGVVSFGPIPCANPGQPAVFSRVGYFVDWILNSLKP